MAKALTGHLILACTLLLLPAAARSQQSQDAPRIYLSQGEWQGAVLTASGHELIADAAKSATAAPMTLLDVNGWADLAATPAAQRRIADARVRAARDELIRDGVDGGDIGVQIVDQPEGWGPPPQGQEIKRVVIAVHY